MTGDNARGTRDGTEAEGSNPVRSLGGLALAVLLVLAPGVLGVPATAGAQPPPAAQDEYVPVTDEPSGEQLPAAPLVIAAYGFAWVAVVIYLWSIWRRLSRVEREIAAVSRRLDGGARR